MMGGPTALLIFLAAWTTVRGREYDSLEQKAAETLPLRVRALRDYFVDPGMFQEIMFHMMSYYVPTDSNNPKCNNHSSIYQLAFLEGRLWALHMMDASTKLGDGVLQGNIQGLGSYDECLAVDEPSHLFSGQFCIVQTSGVLPAVIPNPGTTEFSLLQGLPMDLTLSVCLPSSCSVQDVAVHWQGVMAEVNASAVVSATDCSVRGDTKPNEYTWLALCLLAVLFALVLFSTCYDYSVSHQPIKERRILVSFSVYTNIRKLFHSERRTDSVDMLDGIRVLAISWIVLGHRFEQSLQMPNVNLLNMEKYTTAWFMSPILNMMMAVELFFLLSGCLLTYHFLRARSRGEQFNLAHFYYKRYIRLTPTLALVMLFEGCLMLYVSDGPLWKRLVGNRMESCVNYWWTNLLYISNYVNPYNTCVLQSWYLAADTQLYVLSPLLLLPLARSDRGLLLLAGCYLATTAAAFSNALYLQLPAGATVTLNKKTERNHGYEYVKTHVRAASWLTGVALGYILHRFRRGDFSWKLTKGRATICWIVSVSLCVVAVYSISPFQSPEHQYSPLLDSLHISLHRNVFSLGAAGVILLCITGSGGFIKDVLSWGGFRPLAILSYGVYLSHMGLQVIGLARTRQPLDFDMFTLMTSFLSDLLMANFAAVLIYVVAEAPGWEIGQWLFNPGKETKAQLSEKSNIDNVNLEEEKTTL